MTLENVESDEDSPGGGGVKKSKQEVCEELSLLALDFVRLVKLFFFTVVEHVRSTDGEKAWQTAHEAARSLTRSSELAELHVEFGGPQLGDVRADVVVGGSGATVMTDELLRQLEGGAFTDRLQSQSSGLFQKVGSVRAPSLDTSVVGESASTNRSSALFHDPTSARPLLVMTWLRTHVSSMLDLKAIENTQFVALNSLLDDLVHAYSGIDKIDKLVLPLPYCQLLKIFQLFFINTLPYAIAPSVGPWWTPAISAFTAFGFFGLDQLAAELEGPFGIEDNDFPLAQMGSKQRMEARFTKMHSSELREEARRLLRWGFDWAASY